MAERGADRGVGRLFAAIADARVAEVRVDADGRRSVALRDIVAVDAGSTVIGERSVEGDPVRWEKRAGHATEEAI